MASTRRSTTRRSRSLNRRTLAARVGDPMSTGRSPSATGGDGAEQNTVYPRGVRPRRVIRPLAAMLAMTGVLTGPEADRVGI